MFNQWFSLCCLKSVTKINIVLIGVCIHFWTSCPWQRNYFHILKGNEWTSEINNVNTVRCICTVFLSRMAGCTRFVPYTLYTQKNATNIFVLSRIFKECFQNAEVYRCLSRHVNSYFSSWSDRSSSLIISVNHMITQHLMNCFPTNPSSIIPVLKRNKTSK